MKENTFYKRLTDLPEVKGDDIWAQHQRNMIAHMRLEPPDTPWEWSTVVATMYVGPNVTINRKIKVMKEEGVEPLFTREPDASNLNNQRYHLWLWERQNNRSIDTLDSIVEFGSGYGAMAYVAYRMGFRGTYSIFDLPVMNLMQEYQCDLRGVPVVFDQKIEKPDLLMSIHGLSETSGWLRNNFLYGLRPATYIFAMMGVWYGIDNVAFFEEWGENQFLSGGLPFRRINNPLGPNTIHVISHGTDKR